ncbi:hypothetical protein [Caballeronia sp. 15711]|uniref:hypothetical protein n=1 Tax=Caballeronia sp. 15711 TaxID=3391029 RepID=UPI0039E2C625
MWWPQAILLLGILTALTSIYGVWRHFSPVPLGDQWDGTIGFYMRALQDPASAFFEQHNEHKLAFSRLLFFADVRWFGGRNVSLLIGNLVLAGLLALTYYRVARHYAAWSKRELLALGGVALIVTFSWMQQENLTLGFQSQWFAVYLFALCSFHLIDLCADATQRNDPARTNLWLLLAMACSTLAAYSMASGVLVAILAVFQALYRRVSLARIVVLIMAAAAILYSYFANWHPIGSGGSLSSMLHERPFGVFQYFLLYLGSPAQYARVGWAGAYAAGTLVAAVLVVQTARRLLNRSFDIKAAALLVFALFIAGNALLTAFGRYRIGMDTALTSRYTTASLGCWFALASFTFLNARSAGTKRITLMAATLGVLILGAYQRHVFEPNSDEAFQRTVGGIAVRADVYDLRLTQVIYPNPERLIPTAKAAQAAHLSIFSPDDTDFYTPPDHVSASASCDGHVDEVWATTTPGKFAASGWIYDTGSHAVPSDIVVADAEGKTLGMGVAGGDRPDVETIHGRKARYSRWTAIFTARPGTTISVNGLLHDNVFCALSDKPVVTLATP